MKQGLIAVSILAIIILLIVLGGQAYFGNTAVDIHLHDTYFVLSYSFFILVTVLLLLFVFGLVASISTKFSNRTHTRLLWISGLALLIILLYCYMIFNKNS